MIGATLDPALVVAIVTVAAIIVSALIFAGVTSALRGWRDGLAGLDDELLGRRPPGSTPELDRESEIRQLLEAKSYRRQRAGLEPLDVEAELKRLLDLDS
ncbi:MAG: hypothetical protein ACRDKX_03455 [Solirubrobacterales bacterium]